MEFPPQSFQWETTHVKIKGLLKLNSRMTPAVTSAEVRTLENRSAFSFFSATYTRFHTFCSLLDSFLDFRCVNYASFFSFFSFVFFLIDQALSLSQAQSVSFCYVSFITNIIQMLQMCLAFYLNNGGLEIISYSSYFTRIMWNTCSNLLEDVQT